LPCLLWSYCVLHIRVFAKRTKKRERKLDQLMSTSCVGWWNLYCKWVQNQKALHLEQDDWNAPLDEWHEKRAFTRSAYKERNMTLVIWLSRRIGSVGKGESNWMIHGIMAPPLPSPIFWHCHSSWKLRRTKERVLSLGCQHDCFMDDVPHWLHTFYHPK